MYKRQPAVSEDAVLSTLDIPETRLSAEGVVVFKGESTAGKMSAIASNVDTPVQRRADVQP